MSALLMGIVTGSIFGFALYKVGAVKTSRVLGMLALRDTKIMKFAFAAIATASVGYGLSAILGISAATTPRVMSFVGWAHVLGGLIFGVSMALSGLCPGTAVCSARIHGTGAKFQGLSAVIGLFIGVAIFSVIKAPLFDAGILSAPKDLTLHGWLGLPYGPLALLLGVFFLVLAALIDRYTPDIKAASYSDNASLMDKLRGDWHWLPAGMIAGCVVVWATTQDGFVGYSGSVLAIYGWAGDAIGQPTALVPAISDTIVWRAGLLGGVLLGGLGAYFWSLPDPQQSAKPVPAPATVQLGKNLGALGSGTGLALGAMIGGGCTTGAFISAFPTLSLGSFAMGGTFFIAALVTVAVRNKITAAAARQGNRSCK